MAAYFKRDLNWNPTKQICKLISIISLLAEIFTEVLYPVLWTFWWIYTGTIRNIKWWSKFIFINDWHSDIWTKKMECWYENYPKLWTIKTVLTDSTSLKVLLTYVERPKFKKIERETSHEQFVYIDVQKWVVCFVCFESRGECGSVRVQEKWGN